MATNPLYIGHDSDEQPEVSSLTAFTAYKVLAISSYADSQFLVYGPHYSGLKSLPTDTAVCGAGKETLSVETAAQAPEPHRMENCSCGYYGYADVMKAHKHYDDVDDAYKSGFALATVKMSGEVIVATKGYRAKVQRVASLEYNGCFKCAGLPEVFVSHDNGYYAPVCTSCVNEFEEHKNRKRWLKRRKRGSLETITRSEMENLMTTEGYSPVSIIFHAYTPVAA